MAAVSAGHNVCAKGYFVAIVSTICETSVPEEEVRPALNLLGPIAEKFVSIVDLKVPSNGGGEKNNVFISKTFDATSHFETVCDDVKSLYQRVTGKPLDLTKKKVAPAEQVQQ